MSLSLTVFDSIYDNSTKKRIDLKSFVEFEKLLYKLSTLPGKKAKKGEYGKASSLISPAIYKPDCTRLNSTVTSWAGWAALDVDSYTGKVEDILTAYKEWHYICYSTASSTVVHPKFRLVFPLSRHVPAEKIRHFWFALNKEFGKVGDEQTKDLSRMYYVPAQYPNAFNFIFTANGKDIDPDALMAKHQFAERTGGSFFDRLPEHLKSELLVMRKDSASKGDIRWGSYRDCPFVNKTLVKEYKSIAMTDGSGRYRMIYKIMTSIACLAVKKKYPITAQQIGDLVRELDNDTARIYQKRNLTNEADRAIEFAYRHA